MPPMLDPEKVRLPMIRANAGTGGGFSGAPTSVIRPATPRSARYAATTGFAETVARVEGRAGARPPGRGLERRPACYAEEREVCGDDVVRRDGVEDEVEGAGVLLHLVGIRRYDDFIRAEAHRVFALAQGGGEGDDVSAEGLGELHAHVPEAAETDDADLHSCCERPRRGVASR